MNVRLASFFKIEEKQVENQEITLTEAFNDSRCSRDVWTRVVAIVGA